MKKRKQKPPKLAEQKTVSAFLLAIAKGANLNAKTRGMFLIEAYFDDLFHCCDLSKNRVQFTLKRLKILLTAGADARSLFHSLATPGRSMYQDLLFDLTAQLAKLSLLLGSECVRGEVKGYRRIALKSLQQELDYVKHQLSEMEPSDTPKEVNSELYWLAEETYDRTVSLAWRDLSLLSSLLDSTSARQELNGWRREALDELRQMLYHISECITDTELIAGFPEVSDLLEVQKIHQKTLDSLTKLLDNEEEPPLL